MLASFIAVQKVDDARVGEKLELKENEVNEEASTQRLLLSMINNQNNKAFPQRNPHKNIYWSSK
eukprot:scaffold2573_cov202-Ochromonas_danica.AAC.3